EEVRFTCNCLAAGVKPGGFFMALKSPAGMFQAGRHKYFYLLANDQHRQIGVADHARGVRT
ncbi:hypothetical protein ABC506_31990, partial [Enterobacter hormaechei]|uniref:hypothetical protein n=1 Tax=Enterobacter hormaechei TaxID=158836 RepID=UPI003754F769